MYRSVQYNLWGFEHLIVIGHVMALLELEIVAPNNYTNPKAHIPQMQLHKWIPIHRNSYF